MNILIVRNDKLGDFILTFPCYILLKKALPSAKISVLVQEYTADIARCCPAIDHIIVDTNNNSIKAIGKLVKEIKSHQFVAVITLFSTTRIGFATLLAGIKYRLAPATKFAQLFYNHRLTQRRSRSDKPEFVYNLDLINKFLANQGVTDHPELKPPFITFELSTTTQLHTAFCEKNHIKLQNKLVFVHAGSGGSANNLSLQQYASLIANLESNSGHTVVLTAGPGEEDRAKELSQLLNNIPHVVYVSTEGLLQFAKNIAFADLFIAGSTGPLHIAGALNVPTAAFYTRRRSATPLRWQTLNTPDRRLAFTPPETSDEMDMRQIDIESAAKEISGKFLKN